MTSALLDGSAEMADEWVALLRQGAVDVQQLRVPGSIIGSNHLSIAFGFGRGGFPALEALLPAVAGFCEAHG